MKINTQEAVWAGTESSLHVALNADAQITEGLAAGMSPDATMSADLPELLQIQEGVGVISIKGPLTNRDSWLNSLFGVTSYGAIREALVCAANNEDIKQILLDVDSGGGAVSGVNDTAALISQINESIKPVTTFTDGSMMSAAYWLGCSAGNVFGTSTASIGSIGVIATHMDQSEALKKEGINVTVMRAGKYKALANSNEPLSDAAKKQIQTSLDGAYEVFVQSVADARDVSYEVADTKMAQGREFFGQKAADAGLIDGITSYDTLMSMLAKKAVDTKPKFINNMPSSPKGSDMSKKKALTAQDIAALATGASALAAEGAAEAEAAAAAVLAAEAEAAAAALAAENDASAQPDAQAAATAAAEALATAAAAESESQIVSFLQTELKAANEGLLAAKIELKGMTDKMAESEALFAPMLDIVRHSAANMQVALGGSALNMEGLSATLVLAEHKRVAGVFSDKFKAGGVAAVDAADSKGSVPAMSDLDRARLNAVRSTANPAK